MSDGESDYLRTQCTCPRGPDGFSVNCGIASHAAIARELGARPRFPGREDEACSCPDDGPYNPNCANPLHAAEAAPPDLFPGDRKDYPVFTGLLMYFPNACAAVARCSKVMNEQHNPGEPMHWDMSKSVGTGDETVRHLMDAALAGDVGHAAQHAWRAFEYLERLILAKRAVGGAGEPPGERCGCGACEAAREAARNADVVHGR